MGKDMMMLGKEKKGMISSPKKKFGKAKVMSKPFGFGKQQKQGMKGKPTQYGSA